MTYTLSSAFRTIIGLYIISLSLKIYAMNFSDERIQSQIAYHFKFYSAAQPTMTGHC